MIFIFITISDIKMDRMYRMYHTENNIENYSNLQDKSKEELIQLIDFMREKYRIYDPEPIKQWKKLAFNLQNIYHDFRDDRLFLREYSGEINDLIKTMHEEDDYYVSYWRYLCKNNVNHPDFDSFDLHDLFINNGSESSLIKEYVNNYNLKNSLDEE